MIRTMIAADIADVQRTEKECFAETAFGRPLLTQLLDHPFVQAFVVESPKVCGHVIARIVSDEAEILTFAVSPEHQGQGLGKKLLEHAMAGMKAHNVNMAYLDVRESNTYAQRLYESFGWAPVGCRPKYYAASTIHPEGKAEDALVYSFDFSKLS